MVRTLNDRIFGSYIDRNMKVIRAAYIKRFKELGADITTEQWVIMDHLANHGAMRLTELGTACFKDAPTASRIVELLCKKNLATRQASKTDNRVKIISLSPEGKSLYQRLIPEVRDLRLKGWEQLSEEDYDHFLRIMDRIYDNLT